MKKSFFKKVFLLLSLILILGGQSADAESINIDARELVPHTEIYFSPRSGTFEEGSTFDVPVYLNTKNSSVNGIEVTVLFDKSKLSVIQPSGGNSIIGIWVRPPIYDNSKGIISYTGIIPDGIVSKSGLISMITFKAIASGKAVVSISTNSRILLNDGLGTETALDSVRSEYVIAPKAPEGVLVYSETHPVQSNWYNNNSLVLYWEDTGAEGFSYVIDALPTTIPPSEINTTDMTKSYEKLQDGLWYFHIKAKKRGVWGTAGHFLVRIDTAPPADFKPETNYIVGAVAFIERTLVSFFTTDNLSGVDHYEVGVIDKKQPVTESPVFIETASPYQVPVTKKSDLRVIVRAIDKAGNIRDASIDVKPPFVITKFIKDYLVYILLFIILVGLAGLIIHYLVGHHVIRYLKKARSIMQSEMISEEHSKSEPLSVLVPPPNALSATSFPTPVPSENNPHDSGDGLPLIRP